MGEKEIQRMCKADVIIKAENENDLHRLIKQYGETVT